MDELHKLSAILIERETIDKDQFERLLAGETEESVFPDETPSRAELPVEGPERKPTPKPKPRPVPGAAMQPPEARDSLVVAQDWPLRGPRAPEHRRYGGLRARAGRARRGAAAPATSTAMPPASTTSTSVEHDGAEADDAERGGSPGALSAAGRFPPRRRRVPGARATSMRAPPPRAGRRRPEVPAYRACRSRTRGSRRTRRRGARPPQEWSPGGAGRGPRRARRAQRR